MQAGLGTYTDSTFTSEYLASAAMTVDMMIAWNLESHVKGRFVCEFRDIFSYHSDADGYAFLMQNCTLFLFTSGVRLLLDGFVDTLGDKISIFGFSRGAYTARALAGMLQKAQQYLSLYACCS